MKKKIITLGIIAVAALMISPAPAANVDWSVSVSLGSSSRRSSTRNTHHHHYYRPAPQPVRRRVVHHHYYPPPVYRHTTVTTTTVVNRPVVVVNVSSAHNTAIACSGYDTYVVKEINALTRVVQPKTPGHVATLQTRHNEIDAWVNVSDYPSIY